MPQLITARELPHPAHDLLVEDSGRVVAACGDEVRVYDPEAAEPVRTIAASANALARVRGADIIVAGARLRRFTADLVNELALVPLTASLHGFAVAIDAAGTRLAFCGYHALGILDLTSGEPIATWSATENTYGTSLALDAQGTRLAVCHAKLDGIAILDLATQQLVDKIEGKGFHHVVWHDAGTLVTARSGSVDRWSPSGQHLDHVIRRDASDFRRVATSSEGLVVAGERKMCWYGNLMGGVFESVSDPYDRPQPVRVEGSHLYGDARSVRAIAFSPSGNRFAVSLHANLLQLWRTHPTREDYIQHREAARF